MPKTNFDYLMQLIANGMPAEKHREEATEFLDAIKKEFDEKKDDISELCEEVREYRNRYTDLESEIEERELTRCIKTFFGSQTLDWDCDNISVQSMMQELGNTIGRGIPIIKIENILRAL